MTMWDSLRETMGRWSAKEASAAPRDPKKTGIKKIGQAVKTGSGGSGFEDSPVDLEEIQRAYHTDSYIRRAVDKYAGLMLKNGWDFNGKNEAAVEYVWLRLKLMAEGTGKPMDQLFSELAFDYVLFGNAYLVKSRDKKSQAASGVNAVGYTGKQPVAGYFILPPQTMRVNRDDLGNVVGYEQDVGGGSALSFQPSEVVHLTYRKPTGRAYGVPMIFNALDDVQILRQIEENVARLIYRNLFPLYMYKVGLPEPGFEATDEEIEELRDEIREMPMDGALVVPERHNISAVGAEGNALDASPYLSYYRQRVFTGLNVSETVMGLGGTANRSTSDNQAADLFDGVKEFQRLFMEQIQHFVINEILFEGGFDPTLNVDDEVNFFFHEIELDAKIKKENHVIQMFTQNAITHEEMRQLMGFEPVSDEARLMFNMISAASEEATEATEAANASGDNKDKPENQAGKQNSPGKAKAAVEDVIPSFNEKVEEKVLTEQNLMVTLNSELPIDSYVTSMNKFWANLTEDIVSMMNANKSFEEIRGFSVEILRQSLRGQNRQYIHTAMMTGIHKGNEQLEAPGSYSLSTSFAVEQVSKNGERYVDRLVDDLLFLLERAYANEDLSERAAKSIGALNSNKYRLKFIAKSELYRAYNYGIAVAGKQAGLEQAQMIPHEGCEECLSKSGVVVLSDVDLLEAIPPHHANCECVVQLNKSTEEG